MNHQEIIDSLSVIRPDAKWVLKDEELIWQDDNQTEPDSEELQSGFVAYQEKMESEKKQAAAAKSSAEAKLAALGLTIEDLKALGIG